MKKHITYTEEIEGVECECSFQAVEHIEMLKAKIGNKLVIAYCAQDDACTDLDDLLGDCMGTLYSFHRDARRRDHQAGLEALGNTSEGEMNLEAVWGAHEDEASKRYIACVLHDHPPEDIIDKFDISPEDKRTADELLTDDLAGASSWGCVMYDETMLDVLEKMWSEPEFFPGDRDAQALACYEHSGQIWSLSGQGTQCQWDTNNHAGVWVPDDYLRKELDAAAPEAVWAFVQKTNWLRGRDKQYALVQVVWEDDTHNEKVIVARSDDSIMLHKKAKELAATGGSPTAKQLTWARNQMCKVYCKQFLEAYNSAISGDVYGCVVETFDENGETIDEDSCWGFLGSEYAEEALKSEFFEPKCKKLQNEVSLDLHGM